MWYDWFHASGYELGSFPIGNGEEVNLGSKFLSELRDFVRA